MIKKIIKFFNENKIYNCRYLYIYSDFRIFFRRYKINSEKKVELLLRYFNKNNITCIVPSFSYTTFGKFYLNKTKSKAGFLANYLMSHKKYTRSEHPLFSYLAIGKNKKILNKIGKSAFGKNSVYTRLFNQNCYFLNFSRPLKHGNTLLHHIEFLNKANYRFNKIFKTKVYKSNKFVGTNYSAYVRKNMKTDKTEMYFGNTYMKLKNREYIKKKKIDGLEIEIYPYDLFFKDLQNLYLKNKKIFLKN